MVTRTALVTHRESPNKTKSHEHEKDLWRGEALTAMIKRQGMGVAGCIAHMWKIILEHNL